MRSRFVRAAFTVVVSTAIVGALLGFTPGNTQNTSPNAVTSGLNTDGISWPKDQALPTFAKATHLDVLDVTELSGEQQLLLSTLQGVVNRDRPRIYLIDTESTSGEGSRTWLKDLNVPYDEHDSAADLLSTYLDEIRGSITYDPELPDSVNVATTLAGVKDAVVVSPQLAETLKSKYGLRVLTDLRGKFDSAIEAYTWQYEHLWDKTTHRMLTALAPQREVPSAKHPAQDAKAPFAFLRDYAVANRSMVFWLDPNVTEERALLEKILADVKPGTPYLGWFAADTEGEFEGTELTSSYGVYVLAADWFENLTVHSGSRAPIGNQQPRAPRVPLDSKIYLTFTVSEGDNLQYNEHRMRALWDDPARGQVPINWTTTPILKDAAPAILHHYQSTATPNDLLIAGPSGAGYIYPDAWPNATFDVFTAQSKKYLDITGMDLIYVLNRTDGEEHGLSENTARAYAEDIAPRGLFLNWDGPTQTKWLGDDIPQSTVQGVDSLSEAREVLAATKDDWDGESPAFVNLGVLAWELTPSDLTKLVSELGPEFSVVRGDQYADLVGETLPQRDGAEPVPPAR